MSGKCYLDMYILKKLDVKIHQWPSHLDKEPRGGFTSPDFKTTTKPQ